ncbi:SDR family NAD(P)-dependent oxidoreductase [Aerococcus urinaeequi]|uniref:SDR family NAD(P)-dependent oxidoreductase n=1 Tax=Aerococcus urinaeequi TaxID=51665 RepID=UPI000845F200|nr:glucose 1-dehydrogenase [Aerococcus urinaeequi]
MELGLSGKVAIITGASRGIGFETAKSLASEGADVTIVARREDRLVDAQRAIQEITGRKVHYVVGDVTAEEDAKKVVAETIDQFGRIDILINNAGGSSAHSFDAVDNAEWQRDLNIKVFGVVNFTREVLPYFKKQNSGAIVNLTAIAGKTPPANSLPTSTSRAAGLGLTKELSKELGEYNIRVNAVSIGLVRSEQIEKRWQDNAADQTWEEFSKSQSANTPLGRIGETVEAANAITFLVSDAASYISGVALNIDGGAASVM